MSFNIINNSSIWSQLPVDVVGEILYQVDSSSAPRGDAKLNELKCVSKSFKNVIENQYPQCKARIDLARRVEQFFMTFNDRPFWERVGLVGLGVLTSPILLAYHSPRILAIIERNMVRPALKAINAACSAVFNRVVVPACHFLYQIPRVTYHSILLPAAQTVKMIANGVYENIMLPASQWTYRHVITPLVENIAIPFVKTVIAMAERINQYILEPVFEAIREVNRMIVTAIFSVFYVTGRALEFALVNILIPTVQELYPIAQSILIPTAKAIYSIAQSLFVTLPEKNYANVLQPFGTFVYTSVLVPTVKVVDAVSDAILVPAYRALASGVTLLNEKILQPAAMIFSTVMHYAFVEVPKHLYTALIVPAQAGLEHIGQVAIASFHVLRQTWPFSAL